jgi:ABC-type multidrug transport system, ATPase and permease components
LFKLLGFLKEHRLQAVLAPLFKMLEALFELFVPLVVASMIDKGIAQGDLNHTFKMGGLLLVLAIVGLAFSITAQYFSAVAAIGVGRSLRLELFRHIESLSYKEIDKIGSSTLITRMTSDVNQVQTGVNMLLRLFLRSPFVVFGAVIMAFTVDVKTALIFCIVLPLLVVVVCGVTYGSLPLYKRVQTRLDKVTLLTRESLVGVRVVRAFNRQEQEIVDFGNAAESLKSEQMRVGRLSSFMNPVTYVIVNLGIAAIIYKGGIRVDAGDLTQGQVIALVNYMSQILIELVKLANLIITMTKSVACANRVNDILNLKPSIEFESSDGIKEKSENQINKDKSNNKDNNHITGYSDIPRVEFKDVALNYNDGGDNSLDDITFRAMPGDTIGVIGGTGSGKSSLVNLIPRFYDVTEGVVLIDGRDVRDYGKEELRERIGVVPQKAVLFKGTVAENVRWGKENASDDEVRTALDTAQALTFIEEKEGGINFELNQGARNLSGGQKQRVTIARALVRRPEILILDDSSSALDYATDAALRSSIKSFADGMTVFMVSQRASSIMHADKIIVLDDGRIAGIGTHDELLDNCEIYREICHSQMGDKASGEVAS